MLALTRVWKGDLDLPTTPLDDIVIHRDRLIFGSPFEATMINYSVEPGGNSSKTESEISCSDTYLVIRNLL